MNEQISLKFETGYDEIAQQVNRTAHQKGWWEEERNNGECIALMHSELSEALEAFREGNPESSKIPGFSSVSEELADVIIRIMDFGMERKLDISGAVIAKLQYNDTREYKHGGKQF